MLHPAFRAARVAALFVGTCFPALAHAAAFQVNPVRIQLTAENTSEAITVRNAGTEPVVVQMSMKAWSQADGVDRYSVTHDALVTPPIATIPPGAEQIIRAGLRRRLQVGQEIPFRLFIEEVPPPSPTQAPVGLRVAVRIGVPVFVVPASGARPDLAWTCERQPDGTLRLRVRNRGMRRSSASRCASTMVTPCTRSRRRCATSSPARNR